VIELQANGERSDVRQVDASHVNKWSPLDGAHKLQVTVIDTTSELP